LGKQTHTDLHRQGWRETGRQGRQGDGEKREGEKVRRQGAKINDKRRTMG